MTVVHRRARSVRVRYPSRTKTHPRAAPVRARSEEPDVTEPNANEPSANETAPSYRKKRRSTAAVVTTIAVLAIVAIVAVVFTLTRQGSNEAGGEDAAGELTVGLLLEPTNLDIRSTAGVALDQILIDNIYQGLVGLAPGTVDTFVPVLAEALPQVSSDGLDYTFTLREGVKFHSGNPLTADDVVDSLSAGLTEAVLGTSVQVTASDERTIVISLGSPNSQLLWQLSNRPGLIFESAYGGDLANTANGTGPYALEEWKQGDSITYAANADYWGDAPELTRVVWRYIPDENAAVNAALDGDLDVLAPVASSLISKFDGSGDFTLQRANSTDVFTLGFNAQKPPLDDQRVRAALSQAIDGDAIIEAFYGDGKALGGPITDLEPAYEDLTGVNAYDPKGAKQLLADAGVENLKLMLTVPNIYPLDPINEIVSELADVGVTVEVNSVEFATWLSDVYTAPEDGSARSFDLSYIDHAEAFDFANYTNPGYYFGYDNPKVQQLYAESIAATDADDANELVKEAARLVAEDAPAKWLINYTPTNAIGTNVHGFVQSNTNSRINLEGVSVD